VAAVGLEPTPSGYVSDLQQKLIPDALPLGEAALLFSLLEEAFLIIPLGARRPFIFLV
jgi:hypothetical protein